MCYSRRHSPWLFHMNSGSCNGCDIELVASLTPRYDAEQLGVRLEGSPRHADILCITGPVTHNAVKAIHTVYDQVLGPRRLSPLAPAGHNQRLHRQPHPRRPTQQAHSRRRLCPRLPSRPDAIIQGVAKAAEILAARGNNPPATEIVIAETPAEVQP